MVPMMLMLPLLAGGGEQSQLGWVLLQSAGMVLTVGVFATFLVPRVLKIVASSRDREVFMLAVLAIAGITAFLTSQTGLSLALGAFLAGIILAETQYSHQALADVLPLRAATMCVFFVSIGMLLELDAIAESPMTVLGLLAAIWMGKALVVLCVGLIFAPHPKSQHWPASHWHRSATSFVLSGVAVQSELITDTQESHLLAASVLSIAITPLAHSSFPKNVGRKPIATPTQAPLRRESHSSSRGRRTRTPSGPRHCHWTGSRWSYRRRSIGESAHRAADYRVEPHDRHSGARPQPPRCVRRLHQCRGLTICRFIRSPRRCIGGVRPASRPSYR